MADHSHRYGVFNHATAPNASLYRAVMNQFSDAKRAYTLHLRPSEILTGLRQKGVDLSNSERLSDLDYVSQQLETLEKWGNLIAFQDTTEVTTIKDFERKRFLYQITAAGEAAELALARFEEHFAQSGELQTTALEDIEERLRALNHLAKSAEIDPAMADSLLSDMFHRFEGLTTQAQLFMGNLQRHLDLYQAEEDVFFEYRDMLIDYLDRFIHRLLTATSVITGELEQVEQHIDKVLSTVTRRKITDAIDQSEDRFRKLMDTQRKRWAGLRGWFIGGPNSRSQAEILRSRALTAITDLLMVIEAINERKSNRGDRAADLRAMALWFMQCDGDREAHQLWRAAFGLHPARHLLVNYDTLREAEETPNLHRTSWLEGPTLQIAPRLRKTGRTKRIGKARTMVDNSDQMQFIRLTIEEQSRQLRAARKRLTQKEPILLSDLHMLDPLEFDLFFDLLTRALSQIDGDYPTTEAMSGDGSMEIVLETLQPLRVAEVETHNGILLTNEHRIQIRDLFEGDA